MVVWLTPKGSAEVTSNTAVPAMEPAFRSPSPSSSTTDELGKHLRTRELTMAAPSLGNRRRRGCPLGLRLTRKNGVETAGGHALRKPPASLHLVRLTCTSGKSLPSHWPYLFKKSNPIIRLSLKNYSAKRTENRYSNKYLRMNVHSSSVNNGRKVKTTPVSADGRMDKQNAVYPRDGVLVVKKNRGPIHPATWKNLRTRYLEYRMTPFL